ncbi:arylesterase [uncultured Winogradskyella sp.]|uniref:arylesterase n=1 Tax=uncultured Winogradskyella sp. TaxID=395353 RepID=UPI00261DFEB3|nr:arylesterase [uncultured Winogradskyella sp.]
MSKAEIKHLNSNSPISNAHKLLKFCYFIMVLLLAACGNDKNNKSTQETKSNERIEEPVTETAKVKTILCFGDSITAGYGLDDVNEAFPAILQKRIDSLGYDYTVINSGLSGETTSGGKGRINWILNQDIEIFILELGANDGLRGVPLSEMRLNLQAIVDAVKQKNSKTTIILAGMELPPNMGQDYTTDFRQIFADIARKNNLEFIPFILDNVGGIAELNQSDGIHPTAEGHRILANTVWETLEPLLKK